MIRLRVKEVAEQQGISDVTVLAARTGIAYATAYRLWKGTVEGGDNRSIGILTLYRVAKALGVRTSDLYEEDRQSLAGVCGQGSAPARAEL